MTSTPDQPATKPVETVPKVWPGGFGSYKHSKAVMMVSLGTFISLFVLSIVVSLVPMPVDQNTAMYYVVSIVSSIVGVWFQAAFTVALIAGVKKHSITLNESLQSGASIFGIFFLQSLLLGVIAVASILCLIIPAFFILPRLVLAQYYLVDAKMGIVESIKASWEATRGHEGKIWGVIGVAFLMTMLLITIIGMPFSIYLLFMYSAVFAVLYFWVAKYGSKTTTAVALDGPTPPKAGRKS